MTPREFFYHVTYDFWELVLEVEISLLGELPNTAGNRRVVLRMANTTREDLSYTDVRHRPFGRCYTMQPQSRLRERGISGIKVK